MTHDGGNILWLNKIKTISREPETRSLEERICRLNRCHHDTKEHEISKIYETQENDSLDKYEEDFDHDEFTILKHLKNNENGKKTKLLTDACEEMRKKRNELMEIMDEQEIEI